MARTDAPDLRMSYLEHRSMRIDASRLSTLVEAAKPTDAHRLEALVDWYARYEGAVRDHHTAEDEVLYPALFERDPTFAEADGEMENEHATLADRLTTVRETLAELPAAAGRGGWQPAHAEAVEAVTALRSILAVHLPHEEAAAFPRYTKFFTAKEYDSLNKAAWKAVGQHSVAFGRSWVLDHATPAQRAELLAAEPLLARLVYTLVQRRRYERVVLPLRSWQRTSTRRQVAPDPVRLRMERRHR